MSDQTQELLVVGMPRSGSTWLGKIFDSHPDTVYRHEPDSHSRIAGVPLLPLSEPESNHEERMRQYVATIVGNRASKVCAKSPMFPKTYLSSSRQLAIRAGMIASRIADRLGISIPVAGVPQSVPEGSLLVWKSIESIARLPLYHRALRSARSIHLIRHPCGYIASVQRGELARKFEDHSRSSEDYGIFGMLLETKLAKKRSLSLDYLKSLDQEERLAWRWVLFNDIALGVSSETPHCMTVRYEDLCDEPVAIARQLFEFAKLEWSAQTEAFLTSSTTQTEKGYYSVFKHPAVAANKWREELDADVVERILKITCTTDVGQLYADA